MSAVWNRMDEGTIVPTPFLHQHIFRTIYEVQAVRVGQQSYELQRLLLPVPRALMYELVRVDGTSTSTSYYRYVHADTGLWLLVRVYMSTRSLVREPARNLFCSDFSIYCCTFL